jgi:hypothetical protein
MIPTEVTVVPSTDGPGLVATTMELSPKINGGWHRFYWTGIVEGSPVTRSGRWTRRPRRGSRRSRSWRPRWRR